MDAAFKFRVDVLKTDIRRAVAAALKRFEAATEMHPSAIDVDITKVELMGKGRPEYVLDAVRVRFDL